MRDKLASIGDLTTDTENTVALAAGMALADPAVIARDGHRPFAVAHNDLQVIDLEQFRQQPERIRESITLTEIDSFIDYYQRFGGDSTVIKGDLSNRRFTAVFDYHQPAAPAWCDHKATLACTLSTEWQTWIGKDKKPFEQADFAEFIEMNAVDIVNPDAAEMVQIALTLQAKKKVNFNSGVRLDNGQIQLGYQETIDGTAGPKGELRIPEKFELALRVFQGGEKYKVEAHLRYRIHDGGVKFFYQIVRPERLLEDAFDLVKAQVEKGCLGALILATG